MTPSLTQLIKIACHFACICFAAVLVLHALTTNQNPIIVQAKVDGPTQFHNGDQISIALNLKSFRTPTLARSIASDQIVVLHQSSPERLAPTNPFNPHWTQTIHFLLKTTEKSISIRIGDHAVTLSPILPSRDTHPTLAWTHQQPSQPSPINASTILLMAIAIILVFASIAGLASLFRQPSPPSISQQLLNLPRTPQALVEITKLIPYESLPNSFQNELDSLRFAPNTPTPEQIDLFLKRLAESLDEC